MTEQGAVIWNHLFSVVRLLGIALILKWIFFPRKAKPRMEKTAQPKDRPMDEFENGSIRAVGLFRSTILAWVGGRVAKATGDPLSPQKPGESWMVIYNVEWRDEEGDAAKMTDKEISDAIAIMIEELSNPELYTIEVSLYKKSYDPKTGKVRSLPDEHENCSFTNRAD